MNTDSQILSKLTTENELVSPKFYKQCTICGKSPYNCLKAEPEKPCMPDKSMDKTEGL